jgi:hypothetical protein
MRTENCNLDNCSVDGKGKILMMKANRLCSRTACAKDWTQIHMQCCAVLVVKPGDPGRNQYWSWMLKWNSDKASMTSRWRSFQVPELHCEEHRGRCCSFDDTTKSKLRKIVRAAKKFKKCWFRSHRGVPDSLLKIRVEQDMPTLRFGDRKWERK